MQRLADLWSTASALVVALILLTALPCAAQKPDVTQARMHARTGQQAFEKGDYTAAITSFKAAEAIIHAPPHLLFIARARNKLGERVAAYEVYRRLVDEELPKNAPAPFVRAQKEGRADLAKLEPLLGRVEVEVTGARDADIAIDGRSVSDRSVVVDPGRHEIVATADGYERASKTVDVPPGSATRVTLNLVVVPQDLEVAPPSDDPDEADDSFDIMPILPWAVIGLGAAGLAVGAITGGVASGKVSELRDTCGDDPCPTSLEGDRDSATTFATASTVSFIIGGVIAAAGVTWLVIDLTATDDETSGGLRIRGAF